LVAGRHRVFALAAAPGASTGKTFRDSPTQFREKFAAVASLLA
jgi:hypothetical protein